jgi:uncharacterized protein (DUF58 family)
LNIIKRLFSSPALLINDVVDLPVLSSTDLDELAVELADIFHGHSLKLLINPKASESIKQGEQASKYLGSGMEYEESRGYQAGDEVRRINWRLMARTGTAYTKLFQEERQESWTILLDQRQSMRFGTRKQLKVQQAIKVMGYFAWQAEKLGLPVELICMDKRVRTTPLYEGKGAFEHLTDFANIACPPVKHEQESGLNDELLSCQKSLQVGSRLMIVSDLHDMDEKTIMLLAALQQKVMIRVVLIFDEVEKKLPNMAGLKLSGLTGSEVTSLSADQQLNYQQWAEQYFADLVAKLMNIGIAVSEISTLDGLQALNEVSEVRHG